MTQTHNPGKTSPKFTQQIAQVFFHCNIIARIIRFSVLEHCRLNFYLLFFKNFLTKPTNYLFQFTVIVKIKQSCVFIRGIMEDFVDV